MNKANIYRYLRISSEPDAGTDARIDDCMALAHKLIHAERIYRIYDVQPAENGILLGDTFFEGEKIRDRLAACVRCAVFAVTLGAQSDRLLRKYAVTDPARSVIMQAVLADYTEDLYANWLGREFAKMYPDKDAHDVFADLAPTGFDVEKSKKSATKLTFNAAKGSESWLKQKFNEYFNYLKVDYIADRFVQEIKDSF